MLDADVEPELLMRSVDPSKLHGVEATIKFRFTDLGNHRGWWIVVKKDEGGNRSEGSGQGYGSPFQLHRPDDIRGLDG